MGYLPLHLALSAIYSISFVFTDTHGLEKLVALLIFTDPVMYGFLFTAVMVLFEKDARTNQVLAITPLTSRQYILSKAISFTLLALICSLLILISAHPAAMHLILFIPAVVLSSTLFIFIAIVGVSHVRNFNQFILIIPLVLAPVCLPLLDFFNVAHSWLFYLIPSQACLLLFAGSVGPLAGWHILYSITYLLGWNYFAFRWADRAYNRSLLKN